MGDGWLSVYTESKTHTRHAARGEVGRRRRREKSAPRRHAPAAAATAVRRVVAEGPARAEHTRGGPLRVRHHLGQAALLKSNTSQHGSSGAARRKRALANTTPHVLQYLALSQHGVTPASAPQAAPPFLC